MRLLLFSICFLSFGASAQIVGGEMVASGRKLVTETDFRIEGHHSGWATYVLSVNLEGKVESAELKNANLSSRLDKMDVRNYLMTLQFEEGTHYPKFHRVEVKISMDKSENPPQLEIVID